MSVPSYTTRRRFLTTSGLTTAAALMTPSYAWALKHKFDTTGIQGATPRFLDPDLKALAQRALEAATAAGASYADVRFTTTNRQKLRQNGNTEDNDFTVAGVRALVKGAWGFSAHSELTPEAMVWIGQTAATLGQANVWSSVAPIELGERESAVGNWQMPVQRDPFTVSDEEKRAFTKELESAVGSAFTEAGLQGDFEFQAHFERQIRTFVSTEGASITQTVYNTFGAHPTSSWFEASEGKFKIARNGDPSYLSLSVAPAGVGYEALAILPQEIPLMMERLEALSNAKSLEAPGRYDIVFDGHAMAALVSALGPALEVDRILGYEAMNGTSYITPLEKMLGSTQLAPSVTITADRTMVGGAATVQWDDEGSAAQAFPIIKNGVLLDCATGREFIPEVATWYRKQQYPLRSRGCMTAQNAKRMPVVQTPNLVLHPSTKDTSLKDLLAGIDNGFAIFGGTITMDQQMLTGLGTGSIVYTVRKGVLAEAVKSTGYLIRMPEHWKNLVALGGAQTQVTRGFTLTKGQPSQNLPHSVQAVAAHFKDVALRSTAGEFDWSKLLEQIQKR